jgi:hypothetical protein
LDVWFVDELTIDPFKECNYLPFSKGDVKIIWSTKCSEFLVLWKKSLLRIVLFRLYQEWRRKLGYKIIALISFTDTKISNIIIVVFIPQLHATFVFTTSCESWELSLVLQIELLLKVTPRLWLEWIMPVAGKWWIGSWSFILLLWLGRELR